MNLAFPISQAINNIFHGYGKVLKGIIPDFYPGYIPNQNFLDYNIKEAEKLLKHEGYTEGFETYCIYDKNQFFMHPLLLIYKKSLKKIGIKLSLKGLDSDEYFSQLQSLEHPMKMTRYAPWCADAGYAMFVCFFSSSLGNYSHYNNSKVDNFIENALADTNYETRLNTLHKVQKIIMADYPWVNICNPYFVIARSSNLKGWTYKTYNHTKAQDFYLSV